ncbi:putative esterase [Fibrisoma limi BUZ 3]|uniref:Putative esterase n=1 Tax=Fibrisoma limi BUZ 3 TaxID=1185876 RepID=I2GET7_9BACT|nr:alpha/beta hydrolase-fold protein [Fibrisoma limi]CCH52412.1 putative esterase [Fibrisoma limi BUZ 3]
MHLHACLLLTLIGLTPTRLSAQPGAPDLAPPKRGTVVTETLSSAILRENHIGLVTNRRIKVYLPPDYATSGKAYPVVYYCHNIFWDNERLFEDGKLAALLDRGFANGIAQAFIFVAADYSTPTTGSVYENSLVSGRWLDFTTQELVPFIDRRYRTLRHRDSRAVTGDFMGGRGALKLAMEYPDVFGSVYALHPVATGNGDLPWASLSIDWKSIHQAKSYADLSNNGPTRLFVTISQAFLPNLNRPPFYCDFFTEPQNGELKLHPENARKTKRGFHLEETLEESAANLRTLRGLAFDWGRFDPNQAHVLSNRAFSRKLEDLGVEHEAEEYRGDPWNRTWTADGRFYTRLLPFLNRHLVFEASH